MSCAQLWRNVRLGGQLPGSPRARAEAGEGWFPTSAQDQQHRVEPVLSAGEGGHRAAGSWGNCVVLRWYLLLQDGSALLLEGIPGEIRENRKLQT